MRSGFRTRPKWSKPSKILFMTTHSRIINCAEDPSTPAPLENFSAQRATWLFVCQPEKLDETQQKELALIRQTSPSAETAYCLAQAFMQMIREQTGQQLDTWLHEVEVSHIPELESFARGIQQDKAAVFAGLMLPWSTGPVEGHVNRRQHH